MSAAGRAYYIHAGCGVWASCACSPNVRGAVAQGGCARSEAHTQQQPAHESAGAGGGKSGPKAAFMHER
jgi:hypothetical protein